MAKKSDPVSKKTARLNLMIHSELRDWVHGYAHKKHTSVSAIITDYLVYLRNEEYNLDVEQI